MKIILFCSSGRQQSSVIAGKGNPPAPNLNCLSHINFSATLLISCKIRDSRETRVVCQTLHLASLPLRVIDVSHENANLRRLNAPLFVNEKDEICFFEVASRNGNDNVYVLCCCSRQIDAGKLRSRDNSDSSSFARRCARK